jgi:DNA-binding PadR family transcriptional regulator
MARRQKSASQPDPNELLPLKPVDFLILLSLAGAERHGYAIMLEIAARTDGAVRLEAGNLYRSIRRLLHDRLVIESERRPSPDVDDERRRYYALSLVGRRVLAAEARRMRALVRLAEARRIIESEPA